jgi:hypothetical protein
MQDVNQKECCIKGNEEKFKNLKIKKIIKLNNISLRGEEKDTQL